MRLKRWGAATAIAVVVGGGAAVATSGSARSHQTRTARASQPAASKPNVLFILTDDLDVGEMSSMPILRALLISHGVTFSNAFVSVSQCCPSRTTILRGQYSHNTHVKTNGPKRGGFNIARLRALETSTIAKWLHRDGYRTALIGKYLNGYPNPKEPRYVPPGWNVFESAAAGDPYSEYNYTLNENGRFVHYGSAPNDYGTDVYVHKTQDFIRRSAAAHKPFFAYLALYAPHTPATPAPRHAALFANARAARTPAFNATDVSGKPQFIRDLPLMSDSTQQQVDDLYRARLRSLQAVDEGIAKLVASLRAVGQLKNTYIVFTSDNGFHLGQFRMAAGKETAYDFDVRVPLVMRGPGIPAGRTAAQLVGNVDLAPTFADMGRVVPPSFVDGRSLLGLAHHPASRRPWRTAYLVEHWREPVPTPAEAAVSRGTPLEPPDFAPRTAALRDQRTTSPEFHGVRTLQYLYVEYATGERELYDIRRDPYELHNIVDTADRKVVAALSGEVAALKVCRAATCRALKG